jgi:hypothetical protein
MKRLLAIGLLTLCALIACERQAHAWVNAKFSVGLNWQLQSANNNVLWGAWKNGQVPGPEAFGHPGGHPYGPGMMAPGMMMPPASQGFPYFGTNPQTPQGFPVETAPPPQTALQQQQQIQAYYNAMQQYYSPFQTVSYQNGYYYPNYYYPAYGYQVPSYWYQGR